VPRSDHMLRTALVVAFVANSCALLAHTRLAARPAVARTSQARAVALTPSSASAVPAVGYDAWATEMDYPAFRKEVHDLGQRLANEQGADDVSHLKKMISWSNTCGMIGVLTMWMSSPLGRLVSILGLSTWTCTRWTMIGHHICHGGYNRQDDPKLGGTGRFTTYGFAVGSVFRRCRDWLDWMLPEAWNVEHNNLHHYRLSEYGDPDLVERNMEMLRDIALPRWLKYIVVGAMAAMWKWFYYAPNTYKELKVAQLRKEGKPVPEEEAHQPFTLPAALGLSDPGKAAMFDTGPIDFMRRVMGPYLLGRFFLLPAPLLLLSRPLYLTAVGNLALSDLFSNIHSFIIIYMCPIPQPLLHGRCGTSPPTRASETSARCTGVTCPPARVSPTPTVTRPTDSQTTPEGSVFPSGAHSHRIYPPRCERLSTAPRVGGAALYVEGVVYRGRGVCRSGLCGSPAAAAPW